MTLSCSPSGKVIANKRTSPSCLEGLLSELPFLTVETHCQTVLFPWGKLDHCLMWWPGHQAYVEFYYKVKNSECLHTTCLIRIITLFSSVLQIENQLLEMSERISSERCQQRLTKNTQWMLAICPSNIHQGTALLLKWESSAYSSSGPSQCARYWWHIRREEVGSVS